MSALEKLCCKIDADKNAGRHFLDIFRNNLAVAGIFTPEDMMKFDPEIWGEEFDLKKGQVMILKEYILSSSSPL